MNYVIVGASAAGVNGAKYLRQMEPDANITLISKDEYIYSRCILHHYLEGIRDIKKLEFVEDGFIERNKINWIKGVSVEALDKDKKELTLSNGDVVSYDKVLLATGASTFFPPVKNLKEAKEKNIGIYDYLSEEAATSKPGANGVIYMPYLMGERTPHIDPNVKGGFVGVSLINNHADFVRSVLEGVSFSLKNCLDIIEDMKVDITDVRVSGGGAESEVWRQILADIFNYPLRTIKASEGPALGVAILAGVGVGIYESVEEACEKIIKGKDLVNPNCDNIALYDKIYEVYNSLYPRLKDI